MPKDDFTLAQANDLARHFLGPDWKAEYTGDPRGDRLALSSSRQLLEANSWRDLFRAAGVQLPLRPHYVAKGTSVMFGATAICTAPSNTLAKRIAAALNNHTPDRRGI